MVIISGILLWTILIIPGSFALPTNEPALDLSVFFENSDHQAGGRIVGGVAAPIGAHPWMVAYTWAHAVRSLVCGGSVISTRTVLTAAHCIVPLQIGDTVDESVRLHVGTNRFNAGGQSLNVTSVVVHAHYNRSVIKNDIGIMYTAGRIYYNALVEPITLSFDYVPGGVLCRVAGWGRTNATAPASQHLLEITVRTLGGYQCVGDARRAAIELRMRAPAVDHHVEICTFHSKGRGVCRGDSGSALVRTDCYQQIGVVSWGFPCALGAPDVYVRVSSFRDWILQRIH